MQEGRGKRRESKGVVWDPKVAQGWWGLTS